MNRSEHLTAGEVAGYLDRSLGQGDDGRIETHLEACAECREEMLSVARLRDALALPADEPSPRPGVTRPGRRWLPLAVGGALAASLAGLLLFRPAPSSPPRLHETVRAPDFGEGLARLEIVSPSSDSSVSGDHLPLIWHGSAPSLYRVTVLTESGEPLWIAETQDTSILLPDTVRLLPDRLYFWRVEGIARGITASTGVHRLRTLP